MAGLHVLLSKKQIAAIKRSSSKKFMPDELLLIYALGSLIRCRNVSVLLSIGY